MQFCRAAAVLIAMGSIGFIPSIADAQGRPGRRPAVISLEVTLMSAPREILVLLEEAEQGVKREQWGEATFAMGILLGLEEARQTDLSGVDFFVADENELLGLPKKPSDIKTNGNSKSTVFQRVYELIESLPTEATKIVDLRYGTQAGQKLDIAIADSDWGSIAEVASKYGFTTSGQDALVLLGEHWLRKGDARRAARLLSRAFKQRSASERLGPELGILVASAYQIAGMQVEALSVIESTRTQFNKVDLNWKGTTVGWDARTLITKNDFDKMDLGGQLPIDRIIKQPYYQSGNAARNADTNAGIPLPFLQWHAELHESKQHKDNLELTLKERVADGKSTFIPTRYPISVGQWIIASTYDQRIVAIDALTGRLGWECPYSGMPMGFSMDRFLSREGHSYNLPAPDYLAKRVWGETLLGSISSDGERIFNISELPAIDIAESFAMGPNARVAKPKGAPSYNILQCWSVRDEGKAKWEVGGQKSLTEPKLAGTLFLGSPLPHEKELLILGELNSDLYLLGIAPETGKLLWRQPLTTNYATLASDQMRRSTGAIPAADGAIIVCPTLSGYLVAYDKSNRSMVWAFKYPIRPDFASGNQAGAFGQIDLADFSPLTPRSADNSVVISDGVALFAPSDGNDAYAIKVDDGTLLWKLSDAKINSFQVRYVAGAWQGMAVIVGPSAMVVVDLKSGLPKWPKLDFPDAQQTIGRGVRKKGTYLLPTSGNTILQIDLSKGQIMESVRVEQPLGNLVSVGDRLICATPFELDCYSVREAFQNQLKLELQRDAVSPSGLARQSELALANGDYDAALNFLEQARKIDPNNAEVILLINKTGLAALIADFDKYADRVNVLENIAIDRDKVPYLRLMVKGLQKQGRFKESLSALLKLSRLRTTQRQEQMSGAGNIEMTPQWSVQEDRWIASQVRNTIAKLTPIEMKDLKSEVSEEMDLMMKMPPHVRRVKLGHFDSIQQTDAMRLESAEQLVKQKDYLQAERLMTSDGFLDGADPKSKEAIERRTILASIYIRMKRFDLALSYLSSDANRLAELIREYYGLSNDGLLPFTASPPLAEGPQKNAADWPTGKVHVSVEPSEVVPLDKAIETDTTLVCKWKTRIGDALSGWEIKAGSVNFSFSNAASRENFQIYADVGTPERAVVPIVHSVDSLVLLEFNRQIIAVDTLGGTTREQDGVLWREQFEVEPTPQDPKSWGLPPSKGNFKVASVARSGVVILTDDELSCLDLTTGGKIWTRTGFKGCSFATDKEKLFVHQPKNRLILKLDIRDGAILDEVSHADTAWSAITAVGRFWLMEEAAAKKDAVGKEDAKKPFRLAMVDAADGKKLFSKEFPAGTRLAIDGETGVIILKVSGELTYWNLVTEKEFVRQVETDLKFNQISVQRFGNTLLTMLYSSAWELERFKISPELGDPNFNAVAGRIFAISADDATVLWKQSPIAHQFHFPVAQDRTSPFAVFVRVLRLSKVGTVAVDCLSVAFVDIRTGQVVYSRDDLMPVTRGLGFRQEIFTDQNTMAIDYVGNRVELNWTNEKSLEEPVYDFGYLELTEFKKRIEARLSGAGTKDLQPSSKPDTSTVK